MGHQVITIDPEVFDYDEDEGSNEIFVVSGAFDGPGTAAVVAALKQAGVRFKRVDVTGVEHPDDEAALAAYMAGRYTPNYVADPTVTTDGVEGYVDCKGAIEPPMAERFRQILDEELGRIGADARVSALVE